MGWSKKAPNDSWCKGAGRFIQKMGVVEAEPGRQLLQGRQPQISYNGLVEVTCER